MDRLEVLCGAAIRNASAEESEAEVGQKFDRLASRIGRLQISKRGNVTSSQLIRQGWGLFISCLYRSCEQDSVVRYRRGLDSFKEHFESKDVSKGEVWPGCELRRRLELLAQLQTRPFDASELYLCSDSEAGIILPYEKILWRRQDTWRVGPFGKLTIAYYIGAWGIWATIDEVITWLFERGQDLSIYGSALMGLGDYRDILLAPLALALVVVPFILFWKIPMNPGSLVLTDRGLYHNGKWGAIHVRLNDMCPPRTDRRMLGISLPLDDVVKLRVGIADAQWGCLVIHYLTSRFNSAVNDPILEKQAEEK